MNCTIYSTLCFTDELTNSETVSAWSIDLKKLHLNQRKILWAVLRIPTLTLTLADTDHSWKYRHTAFINKPY